MYTEKRKDYTKKRCKIFCIYFQNSTIKKDINKNKRKEEEILIQILDKIAKIGETDHFYNCQSLKELYNKLDIISSCIQSNFGLKIGINE